MIFSRDTNLYHLLMVSGIEATFLLKKQDQKSKGAKELNENFEFQRIKSATRSCIQQAGKL